MFPVLWIYSRYLLVGTSLSSVGTSGCNSHRGPIMPSQSSHWLAGLLVWMWTFSESRQPTYYHYYYYPRCIRIVVQVQYSGLGYVYRYLDATCTRY